MIENYEDFYNSLGETSTELENKYKEIKTRKRKIIITWTIIVICINILILMWLNVAALFFLPFILVTDLTIMALVNTFAQYNNISMLNMEYKQKVIEKMLANFIDDVEYNPNYAMPKNLYNESRYPGSYNIYEADDYIERKINGQKIIMADLQVEEETTTVDSKGNVQKYNQTIFSGIYSKIFLDKSICSSLMITMKSIYISSKNKMKLDSSEFEKYFKTYSDNKIITLQILTTDIMQDILDLYLTYKIKFYMYINNNNLYLLFDTGNLFEVFSSNKTPKQVLERYFYILKFIYSLSNKLTKTIDQTQI